MVTRTSARKQRLKDLEEGRIMEKTTVRSSNGDGTGEQRKTADSGSESEDGQRMFEKMFEKFVGELDTWRKEIREEGRTK